MIGHSAVNAHDNGDCDSWTCPICAWLDEQEADKCGMCTACGSVEVLLNRATGTRDLSGIGESAAYPTGHGCELCA